jgi:hypothetical protein
MGLRDTTANFWAITAYFNPCGYRRRLANFRTFRKALRIPLVAVELSFDGVFELTRADADILIQLNDGDIMWQKERLLDVALQSLPDECDFVAWLDCDVLFQNDSWPDCARRQLRRVSLVQLFHECVHLAPDARDFGSDRPQAARIDEAAGWKIAAGKALADDSSDLTAPLTRGYTIGLAWAASRELVQKHSFYDACILGGGDRAIVSAAIGDFARCISTQRMNPQQAEHYRRWAEPFATEARGRVGGIDGRLFHLWHGDLRERRYRLRHRDLARFSFDPFADITGRRDSAWKWATTKPLMQQFVRGYFFSRNEDGRAEDAPVAASFSAAAPK